MHLVTLNTYQNATLKWHTHTHTHTYLKSDAMYMLQSKNTVSIFSAIPFWLVHLVHLRAEYSNESIPWDSNMTYNGCEMTDSSDSIIDWEHDLYRLRSRQASAGTLVVRPRVYII